MSLVLTIDALGADSCFGERNKTLRTKFARDRGGVILLLIFTSEAGVTGGGDGGKRSASLAERAGG